MRNKWGRKKVYVEVSSSSDEDADASRKNARGATSAAQGMGMDQTSEEMKKRTQNVENASAVTGPSGSGGTEVDLVSEVVKVGCVKVEAATMKVEDSLEALVSLVGAEKEKSVDEGKSADLSDAACSSKGMTAGSSMAEKTADGSKSDGDPFASSARMSKRRRISSLARDSVVDEDGERTAANVEVEAPKERPEPQKAIENKRSLNLRGDDCLNDKKLKELLKKKLKLESLDIHDCPLLTKESIDSINKYGKNLRILTIGGTAEQMFTGEKKKVSGPEALQKLIMWKVDLSNCRSCFFDSIKTHSTTLTWLDISGTKNITCFKFLTKLVNLEGLVMYDVSLKGSDDPDYSADERGAKKDLSFFQVVDGLSKKIGHLDISCSLNSFVHPSVVLGRIVSALPALEYLDISETNLAGKVGKGKRNRDSCSIPGLEGRVNRPLEYLGLYKTLNDACKRDSIPAKIIGGSKDEGQILAAVRAHIEHQELLEAVLIDLVSNYSQSDQEVRSPESLELILLMMNKNRGKKGLQILGSACIYYILKKHKEREMFTEAVKQKILSAVNIESQDWELFLSGDFTAFLYEQLIQILLGCVNLKKDSEANTGDSDVERIAVDILCFLGFDCDREQRRTAGKLGVVQKMLSVISSCLDGGGYEEAMNVAWLVLFNVTDEAAENSQSFLESDGMAVYFRYHKVFSRRHELLNHMTGLMGNVAEVESLRVRLMTGELINIQYGLLLGSSKQNKISEVAFFAGEFFVRMLCDGESSWTVDKPSRADVRDRLRTQIRKWEVKNTTGLGYFVNYKCLSPFLLLLKVAHTVECKLWAAWVLADFTKFEAEKYVRMIEKEEGILEELRSCEAHEDPECPELALYARRTLENVANFNEDFKINLESQNISFHCLY